jgi:CRP/FNR family cyclic AMP-dependent transcriptional regulator
MKLVSDDRSRRPLSPFFVKLAKKGREMTVAADTVFIRENSHGDDLYFIEDGLVRVFSTNEDGAQVIIGDFGPGYYVGEMSLESHRRSASVMAVTATRVAVVTRETLLNEIRSRPEHALEMIYEVTRRARETTDTLKSLALLDTYRRLARFIEGLIGHPAVPAIIMHFPDAAEIAQRIAASEHAVAYFLEELERDEFIEMKDDNLIVRRNLPPRW